MTDVLCLLYFGIVAMQQWCDSRVIHAVSKLIIITAAIELQESEYKFHSMIIVSVNIYIYTQQDADTI